MFGAFRPSAPLSGGLLWKIPWRLSAPQKLRQRRRLRKVDNVVSVLDTALKRQHAFTPSATAADTTPNQIAGATPTELATTAEGRRLLAAHTNTMQPEERKAFTGELPSETRAIIAQEARQQNTIKLIQRWKAEMPTEQEMLPRDKYSMFDRKAKHYRKGVHKLPKWTRVSQRLNPPGF